MGSACRRQLIYLFIDNGQQESSIPVARFVFPGSVGIPNRLPVGAILQYICAANRNKT